MTNILLLTYNYGFYNYIFFAVEGECPVCSGDCVVQGPELTCSCPPGFRGNACDQCEYHARFTYFTIAINYLILENVLIVANFLSRSFLRSVYIYVGVSGRANVGKWVDESQS